MKTFAEIRTYAIEQYSRIAEKQAEVDAAYEKMAGMKIYTPEYLTKIKKAGEAEVAAVRADAAANLEAVVKLTLAEKKTALEKMLATAPSTEQTNLLNTLQVQGNRITPDEIKSIAVQLSGNYRALHALQAIAEKAGHMERSQSGGEAMELPACKEVGAYHPQRDTARPVRRPCPGVL